MRNRWILVLLLACVASPAGAVVRRCVAQDGTLVFTDRRCADVGAVERPQPDTAATVAPVYRDACPRTLRDLVDRLRAAADVRDVNQLAALYQWNGQSTRTAYDVMNRLQKIVDRPLLDIGPVYSGGVDEDDVSVPTHRPLTGLRLEQSLADGVTPSRTVLGLRRSLGCWWVSL
jgi:hypothetical protein